MSEYENNEHCWECDGSTGHHYPGCIYDGTDKVGKSYRLGGSSSAKFVFSLFLIVGMFFAVFVPPVGVGIILLGAKITNV